MRRYDVSDSAFGYATVRLDAILLRTTDRTADNRQSLLIGFLA